MRDDPPNGISENSTYEPDIPSPKIHPLEASCAIDSITNPPDMLAFPAGHYYANYKY